jgi:hypothetical protein
LTTLLSWAWIALVIEVDNAFEAACSDRMRRHFRISFAMWANGLRCIDEGGITVGELRAASKAACNLGGLERWGWIAIGDAVDAGTNVSDKRRAGFGSHRGITDSTVVRPTPDGSLARRMWPEILERVEHAWWERFGGDAVETVRAGLDGLGRKMPWAPPEVHPSDGFWTHIRDADTASMSVTDEMAGTAGKDKTRDTSEETIRPLAAVLGQALTTLTLNHEAGSQISLPLAVNGLRLLGDGPVRIRDLPVRGGISKEAVAMVTGYLARKGLAEVGAGRTISLTSSGAHALRDYHRRAEMTQHSSLRMPLYGVLAQSDALSAGLVPPTGCWRGEAPYLKQTARLLADPTEAMPRHPMVLHRGGWPDGS